MRLSSGIRRSFAKAGLLWGCAIVFMTWVQPVIDRSFDQIQGTAVASEGEGVRVQDEAETAKPDETGTAPPAGSDDDSGTENERPFTPTEKIEADQEVDFPYDI